MIITTDVYKHYLLDINFRTALLESLEWNEDSYEDLVAFLNSELQRDDMKPSEIIEFLKEHFTIAAAAIIENIFKEAYIDNGMPVPSHEEN